MENFKKLVANVCDLPPEVNEYLNVIQELDDKSTSLRRDIEEELRTLNSIAESGNKKDYMRHLIKKAMKYSQKKYELMVSTLALVGHSLHNFDGNIESLDDSLPESQCEALRRGEGTPEDDTEIGSEDHSRTSISITEMDNRNEDSSSSELSWDVKQETEWKEEELRHQNNETARNEPRLQTLDGSNEASTSTQTRDEFSNIPKPVGQNINENTERVEKLGHKTLEYTSPRDSSTKYYKYNNKQKETKKKCFKRSNPCDGQGTSTHVQSRDKNEKKRVREDVDENGRSKKTSPRNQTQDVTQVSEQSLYCFCKEIAFGNMMGCENETCPIEWFHFECVGLTSPPTEDWFCPLCR